MQCCVKFFKTETEKAWKESKESQDSFIDMLKYADCDCFPNVGILLAIGCISPIGSTEAERAARSVRWVKTPYRATMGDKCESDLSCKVQKRWTLKKCWYYSEIVINADYIQWKDNSINSSWDYV